MKKLLLLTLLLSSKLFCQNYHYAEKYDILKNRYENKHDSVNLNVDISFDKRCVTFDYAYPKERLNKCFYILKYNITKDGIIYNCMDHSTELKCDLLFGLDTKQVTIVYKDYPIEYKLKYKL